MISFITVRERIFSTRYQKSEPNNIKMISFIIVRERKIRT